MVPFRGTSRNGLPFFETIIASRPGGRATRLLNWMGSALEARDAIRLARSKLLGFLGFQSLAGGWGRACGA